MKKGKEVRGEQKNDEGEGERGKGSNAGQVKLIKNAFIPS